MALRWAAVMKPFHPAAVGRIHLFEDIRPGVDHLFLPILREELPKIGAQTFQDIHQGVDGGGGQIPLQLGDEGLAQFRPIRQFLLGEA